MEKFYQFEQTFQNNNDHITIIWSGTPKQNTNINKEKIKDLLSKIFYSPYSTHCCISRIRTIMKDLNEEYLELNAYNIQKNEARTIIYENGILQTYRIDIVQKAHQAIEVKYNRADAEKSDGSEPETNIKINYNTNDFPLNDQKTLDLETMKELQRTISNTLEQIYTAQTIEPIILDRNAQVIYEMYQLFYQKKPDFNSLTIHEEFQAMMIILIQYNISLGYDAFNHILTRSHMPMSISLYNKVNDLSLFQDQAVISSLVHLTDTIKQKIKVIGQTIQDYLKNSQDPIIELINISNLILNTQFGHKPLKRNELKDPEKDIKRLQLINTTKQKLEDQEEQ